MASTSTIKSFRDRLAANEPILVAEGYLFELERRGYLKTASVPELISKNPEAIEQLHREFVRAGSDAVVAFTHFDPQFHKNESEILNRTALRLAKNVAVETGTLMAGSIRHTPIYDPESPKSGDLACCLFKASIEWAVQEGADFIIGESFTDVEEATLAVECIKEYGAGLPSVITFSPEPCLKTRDGHTYAQACQILEDAGADVVGVNCSSGPAICTKLIEEIRSACHGPIAAMPVPYRTDTTVPTIRDLIIPETGKRAFPANLDYFYCSADDIVRFGEMCKEIGVLYVGLCCGNNGRFFGRLAETMGRRPIDLSFV